VMRGMSMKMATFGYKSRIDDVIISAGYTIGPIEMKTYC